MPRLVRRSWVARKLGITKSAVQWLELKGHIEIHERDEHGQVWFDREKVEAFAQSYKPSRRRERPRPAVSGKLSALAFQRFRERRKFPDIVIELELPPEAVRALYHEFITSLEQGEVARRDAEALRALETQEREQARQQAKSAYRDFQLQLARARAGTGQGK